MGLREAWIGLVPKAATGTKRTRTLLTPIGMAAFGVFVSLFVFAAVALDRLLNLPRPLPEAARFAVSIPLIALGVLVTAWSAFHFLKARGTPVPFNPPPEVVKTGPDRHARNPMLSGVFLFLFGLGFIMSSVSLVIVFTPLFVLVNTWELKAIEEPELVKRLGAEYIAYREQTPMFVPRRRPKRTVPY